MINIKEHEQLSVLNHSCAHLLAQAVKHLYPQAKFWVGPVISEGFYYDIDLQGEVIREDDLANIEKEMKKLSKDGKRIVRKERTNGNNRRKYHYPCAFNKNIPQILQCNSFYVCLFFHEILYLTFFI